MNNIIKDKSPGQLVFGQDMILPIKHVADWRYIHQRKYGKIEKDFMRKSSAIMD